MRVLILAIEKEGTRSKALIKLCGIPLVRRLLYTFRAAGLRDVIVVTRPDGQLVREAVGDGEEPGMRITYVESFPQLKEMGDENFLVLEGNYILDERIIRELTRGNGVIVAYDSEPRQAEGVQVFVKGDRLQKIGPDLEESNGAYVGAALCNTKVLPLLKGRSWLGCLSQMAQEGRIAALDVARIEPYVAGMRRRVKPFWFSVETEEDARLCKEALIEAQKRTLDVLAWYFNRPNDIDLFPPSRAGGENTFDGVVSKMTYLGDKIDYRIAVGGSLELRVQTDSKVRFEQGESVCLQLPVDRCRAIVRD